MEDTTSPLDLQGILAPCFSLGALLFPWSLGLKNSPRSCFAQITLFFYLFRSTWSGLLHWQRNLLSNYREDLLAFSSSFICVMEHQHLTASEVSRNLQCWESSLMSGKKNCKPGNVQSILECIVRHCYANSLPVFWGKEVWSLVSLTKPFYNFIGFIEMQFRHSDYLFLSWTCISVVNT